MPKQLGTASPADVLAALDVREGRLAELTEEGGIPRPRTGRGEQLAQLLEAQGGVICAKLVSAITGNALLARLQLSEVEPLREFFKDGYREREVLDSLRAWLKPLFGDRVHVEGDMAFGGLYFEFVWEGYELEPFPINHQDLPVQDAFGGGVSN